MSPGFSLCLLPGLQRLGAGELMCFTGHRGDSGSQSSSGSRRVSLPRASAHRMTQLLGSSVNYGMMGHSTARNKSSALVRSRWLASTRLLLAGGKLVYFQASSLQSWFSSGFPQPFLFFFVVSLLAARYYLGILLLSVSTWLSSHSSSFSRMNLSVYVPHVVAWHWTAPLQSFRGIMIA